MIRIEIRVLCFFSILEKMNNHNFVTKHGVCEQGVDRRSTNEDSHECSDKIFKMAKRYFVKKLFRYNQLMINVLKLFCIEKKLFLNLKK